MWIERPLEQDCEWKILRQRLCKSKKIWEMLKRHDQQPESLKKYLRRCWMVSETVWVLFGVQTMRTTGQLRKIMNTQILPSREKMRNLAGWWVQSPRWYSIAHRVYGSSRWGLRKWNDWNGGTWPTTSVREIWSTGRPIQLFRPLRVLKQTGLQQHYYRKHLDSLCNLLRLFQDNPRCHIGLLDQEVVKCCCVQTNHSHTTTYHLSCRTLWQIGQRWTMWSLLNP